jgi:hypothetical protein
MGPKDVIRNTFGMSDRIMNSYLSDLSDDDLLISPIKGMHPIALQLGHLIGTENYFAELLAPGKAPALPAGFKEAHDIKSTDLDPSKYLKKSEYLELAAGQRGAILAVLDSLSDADLDDTRDGTLPSWAPTVGAILSMTGWHGMMHFGQFVAVRRKLEKPIAI